MKTAFLVCLLIGVAVAAPFKDLFLRRGPPGKGGPPRNGGPPGKGGHGGPPRKGGHEERPEGKGDGDRDFMCHLNSKSPCDCLPENLQQYYDSCETTLDFFKQKNEERCTENYDDSLNSMVPIVVGAIQAITGNKVTQEDIDRNKDSTCIRKLSFACLGSEAVSEFVIQNGGNPFDENSSKDTLVANLVVDEPIVAATWTGDDIAAAFDNSEAAINECAFMDDVFHEIIKLIMDHHGHGPHDHGPHGSGSGPHDHGPHGSGSGEGGRPGHGHGKPRHGKREMMERLVEMLEKDDEEEGDRPHGKPEGERPEGERPEGERPERPEGERPEGERPEKPEGERPEGERPEGKRPGGRPGHKRPDGRRPGSGDDEEGDAKRELMERILEILEKDDDEGGRPGGGRPEGGRPEGGRPEGSGSRESGHKKGPKALRRGFADFLDF